MDLIPSSFRCSSCFGVARTMSSDAIDFKDSKFSCVPHSDTSSLDRCFINNLVRSGRGLTEPAQDTGWSLPLLEIGDCALDLFLNEAFTLPRLFCNFVGEEGLFLTFNIASSGKLLDFSFGLDVLRIGANLGPCVTGSKPSPPAIVI